MATSNDWVSPLVKRVSPGVATIFTSRGMGSGFALKLTQAQARKARGAIVVTNSHVVDGTDGELFVRFSGAFDVVAELMLKDPVEDVAFLRIDPKDASRVSFALRNTDTLNLGEPAVALGSPYRLECSVSLGVVSGVGRSIGGRSRLVRGDMIQSDILSSFGGSGGPIIDQTGKVIGITTLGYRAGNVDSLYGNNIPMAVSANTIRDHFAEALEYGDGEIRRGKLGMDISTVGFSPEEQRKWRLRDGVRVAKINGDKTPAAQAGLMADDIIIGFMGKPVDHHHDIQLLLDRSTIGKECEVTFLRGGVRRKTKIVPS